MSTEPLQQEFPVLQTHTIQKLPSVSGKSIIIYEEKMGAHTDAYYTLLGPLLIAFIGMRSDKRLYKRMVPGVSFLIAIGYIGISGLLQQSEIEELVFDEKKAVFQRQTVPLKHDSSTDRMIKQTIPFSQIDAVQYLECPLDKKKMGYELNLVLNNHNRINIFTHRDATMGIEANFLARRIGKPLVRPECQVN
jgi:hypothetical protein